MSANPTCIEVAEHLKRAIRGEIAVRVHPDSDSWDATYCGNVLFLVGDWRVEFFNDCDELDYCDAVDTPDGRHAEFDDWWSDANADPTMMLTTDELRVLDTLLRGARS